MKRIDLREITVILAVLLFACVVLLSSCSTKKKAVTSDATEIGHKTESTFEKDSSVIEYLIDTTKVDATEVVFTKIDYFSPDSVSSDPEHKPAIKSVTTGTIRKHHQTNGVIQQSETAVKQVRDTMTRDTMTVTHQTATKSTTKVFQWWWLLLLLLAIMLYLYKKIK